MALAFARQWLALPVPHDSACPFDDRYKCRKVMEFEPGFNHKVNLANRDQAVVIAISAIERIARRRDQAFECLPMFSGKCRRRSRRLHSLSQLWAFAGARRLAVEKRALACSPNPALSDDGLINHAEYRDTILDKRNQCPENWPPADKAARPVDGIEHPHP